LQVELHQIGETALQPEIRHAAGELRGRVCVTTEVDRDFAGTLIGVG